MTTLVKVPFHGEELWAVEEGGVVYAVLKRMCEIVGVASCGQETKLKTCSWARTKIILVPDARGIVQGATGLELDSVPMWLTTINERKVVEARRPMLLKLQLEAKQVLANHFFKRKPGPEIDGAAVMRLLDVMVETQRQQGVILERLTALELRPVAAVGHTITPAEAASIRIRKAQIARLMVELGEVPKARAAHAIIWEGIQRAAEWYGKCATIDTMPTRNYAEVDRYLRERRTELERRREAAKPRQLDIFRKPALVRLPPPTHASSDSALREEGPA